MVIDIQADLDKVLANGRKDSNMVAMPTSDMPGHKRLHERVSFALDRCQEMSAVDFKESASWETDLARVLHYCSLVLPIVRIATGSLAPSVCTHRST